MYCRLYSLLLGALGSWGAALLEPYSDNPDTSGIMLITPDKLERLVDGLWLNGWQVVSIKYPPQCCF